MTQSRVLALFDFDKTLVARDSFRMLGELGARSSLERALLFAYAGVTKLGWIDNTRYKELVLTRIWCGRTEAERAQLLDALSESIRASSIEATWARLREHLDRGDRVAILSASPEFYLGPYMASISGDIQVLASSVEETGAGVVVDNLFRDRKATRAKGLIEEHIPSRVVVYTDHRDDLPMMKLAQHIVLVRPFEDTIESVRETGIPFEVLVE